MIIAALDTGMRRGEMLALRFGDIDWKRRMIALLRAGALDAGGQRLPEDPLFWAAFVLVGEAA